MGAGEQVLENENSAVVLTVVAGGPDSIVVSGGVGVRSVATANGDRLSVTPQTREAVTEVVMSTQSVPFQWSRRAGGATEPSS